MDNDKFSFAVEKQFGVLSEGKGGWKVELNMVSWGGRPAKFDIRSWDQNHEKMGKGVTLTKEEAVALRDLLNSIEL